MASKVSDDIAYFNRYAQHQQMRNEENRKIFPVVRENFELAQKNAEALFRIETLQGRISQLTTQLEDTIQENQELRSQLLETQCEVHRIWAKLRCAKQDMSDLNLNHRLLQQRTTAQYDRTLQLELNKDDLLDLKRQYSLSFNGFTHEALSCRMKTPATWVAYGILAGFTITLGPIGLIPGLIGGMVCFGLGNDLSESLSLTTANGQKYYNQMKEAGRGIVQLQLEMSAEQVQDLSDVQLGKLLEGRCGVIFPEVNKV